MLSIDVFSSNVSASSVRGDEEIDNVDDDSAFIPYDVQYAVVLKITSIGLIIFTSILGNSVVIYTIVRDRSFHRPPFYYLLSLCMSDLARTLFCLPFVLSTLLHGSEWSHGQSVCILTAFTNTVFMFSSVFSLFTIAVDRHLAVIHSKFHTKKSGGIFSLAVVVIGWGVSFAIAFPPIFGLGTYKFIPLEAQCTFDHRYYKINDTLGFALIFTGLLLAIFYLYTRVFLYLRTHRKLRPIIHQPAESYNWTFVGPGSNGQAVINWLNGFGSGPYNPLSRVIENQAQTTRRTGRLVKLRSVRNEHLSKLFFSITAVFTALWFPYMALCFWKTFSTGHSIPASFEIVAAWITYLQVAIIPLTYISRNCPFRDAIKATFKVPHSRGR